MNPLPDQLNPRFVSRSDTNVELRKGSVVWRKRVLIEKRAQINLSIRYFIGRDHIIAAPNERANYISWSNNL